LALKRFETKVNSKEAKIAVIGLGYVGLPLAVAFADAGFSVTGLDIDKNKTAKLNAGISYIDDLPSSRLKEVLKKKRFRATDEAKSLSTADAVLICVPTPLGKTKEPDISFVIEAAKKVSQHLKRGQLVVLESTTYPGTTEEVMRPILEDSGLVCEKDFFLAFSPERVDPGNKEYDTAAIPKVVGGVGPLSGEAVKVLYGAVMKKIVPVSSARAAEMAKLLENTFRIVNIGLINEIGMMCNRFGVDVWEVIDAAKTKPFGFMAFYPGPGIGGHCIPIDPLYLSWESRRHGFEAKMIELASAINKSMPVYVVKRIAHLLGEKGNIPKGTPILVLGVTYKKDIDDVRESPAIDVMNLLMEKGFKVSYSDPHVPSMALEHVTMKSQPLTPSILKKQKCVVILTDHSRFDYKMVLAHSRLVFDTRNALRKFKPKNNLSFL
jgi:UDP-N-acetyl-D-glucosamine dehydrogenase